MKEVSFLSCAFGDDQIYVEEKMLKITNTNQNGAITYDKLKGQILTSLKKKTMQTMLSFGFVISGTMAFVLEAAADPVRVTNLGGYSSLNFRSGPTLQSEVIDRLPASATGIEWTGNQVTNGSTLWYEIIYQGNIGWAAANYLELVPESEGMNGHLSNEDGVTSSGSVEVTVGNQTQSTTGEQVGAAIFGLLVGGLLASALSGDDGDNSEGAQPEPTPTPEPTPEPIAPNRGWELSCTGSNVSFNYERATGDIRLTIGGRRNFGQVTERVESAGNSFALPFTAGRGDGILVVDDLATSGTNASIYWSGIRQDGLYNVNCRRRFVFRR